ncbi:MAG: hypothetical protein F6K40_34355 [Okeania sp. SIO3I5]|uniref:DNA-processing protein DprA n=1 Tax=Okeania sp. SIO3I5 TaxID=2607805 RepID=UPI0013BD8668|nr:DNA-processing protein DprA [Okeania sp. SIO3I5]NEQ41021.1 hypothetical protein [Okeania sp. SIO3I5]
METNSNDRIILETIDSDYLDKFRTLNERLKSIKFPFPTPTNPEKALYFWDKFKQKDIVYELRHVEPPSTLYYKGKDWNFLNVDLTVGFGGTESPSVDGSMAAILLGQLVCEYEGVVISGGVFGVDMMAHLGALDVGGKTFAVLGNDVNSGLHPYVPQRKLLETSILNNGGLISEYPDFGNRFGDRLLQRDRIITALSKLFIVIESGEKSATVDTAKRAYLQGRTVFAINWDYMPEVNITRPREGNIQLINELIALPFPNKPIKTYDELADEFKNALSLLPKLN